MLKGGNYRIQLTADRNQAGSRSCVFKLQDTYHQ